MGKLIDADALIFDLKTSFVPQSMDYTNALAIALRWLREAPEAVVRCNDCEYSPEYNEGVICSQVDRYPEPDEWCCWGKRRSDDA
jgi:hypothetical protein